MKKCPFCSEEIQDTAVKCKHCSSDLSGKSIKPAEVIIKKKTSAFTWLVLIILTPIIIIVIVSANQAPQIAKDQMAVTAQEEAQKKIAEEKAMQDPVWKKSKAGQICAKHPGWTKDDCDSLAANKIWVGMTYDMIVSQNGKPNSSNPSNYGSGTRMQYCWTSHQPSCFYDNNGDGVIDAFN